MHPFTITRAADTGAALQTLASGQGESRFVAGGTNLVDLMKTGVEAPDHLVDISRLDLAKIEEMPGRKGKRIPGSGCGAIDGFNRVCGVLGTSESCIATHPSDMCVALAALDAFVQVQTRGRERTIPFADFHRLPGEHPEHETNLEPGELIVAVDLPSAIHASKSYYLKVRDRASYAFALVSVAAVLCVDGGRIETARLALGGVAHKPWRCKESEEILTGEKPTGTVFQAAADAALKGARGYRYNAFKIELAKRAIVRALSEACVV